MHEDQIVRTRLFQGRRGFKVGGAAISIITDPYTPGLAGLDPAEEPADVVIMSSAIDTFHSCSSMVPGDPEALNALEIAHGGPVEVSGVVVEALPSMESLKHEESPAENAIYCFEAGGG
jgi:Beta-lactamase superfamily domain